MSKSTFTVPIKKESSGSVIKVIRRQKGKQEPSVPTFNPPPVNLQNVQHSEITPNLAEVGGTKSRKQTLKGPKLVTENKAQIQGFSSSKTMPPTNPSRKIPKRPEKPESAFTQFIKKRAPLLEAKGATDGYAQASKCWQSLSPALKNRYEGDYQKAKTKYLSDIVKYDEKVKSMQVKEDEKNAKGTTPIFALPMNNYVSKKHLKELKTDLDPKSVISKPVKVDLKPLELLEASESETIFEYSQEEGVTPKHIDGFDGGVPVGIEEKDHSADSAEDMSSETIRVDMTDTVNMSSEIPTKAVQADMTDAVDVSSEILIEAETTKVNHDKERVKVVEGTDERDTQGGLGKLFVCKICESTFSSIFWFEKHMKKCLPSYQCEQCPKKFKEERSMKRHVKVAHTEGKQCNICGLSFTTEKKLENHIMMIHEAEKVCPKCGKVYKNRKSLWKHKKQFCDENIDEHEKSAKVSKRPLVEYEVASDTDSELSDTEDGDRNPAKKVKSKSKLKCVECPKTYNSSRGLRAHKKKYHGTVQTKPPSNDAVVDLVVDGQSRRGRLEDVNIEYVFS